MMLEIITHQALSPALHGFFTRKGGASSGVFWGLNCGMGSSDQESAVIVNRERVASAMYALPEDMQAITQVHSADVVAVETATEERPRADALVTATPGVVLTVLTADCQPVLFANLDGGVVGAAHAGWRGTLDGVLEATVEAMIDLGADRERITAVVGPSISQAAYEVGADFMDTFMMADPQAQRFFAQGKGDRVQFDLPGYGVHRLRETGIGYAEWTRHCTYADPERFYSFRRATHRGEADYGRLLSAIKL